MPAQFTDAARKKIEQICSRYPNRLAACLPALHIAQAEFGPLSDDVINAVADVLGIPAAHVLGVATFYTMFRRDPVGKNSLRVCTNISCMLRGGYDILHEVERQLGIKKGETTSDGLFTIVEEECLAACANAPMMICGTEYYLDLTPEKIAAILADLRLTPRPEHVQ